MRRTECSARRGKERRWKIMITETLPEVRRAAELYGIHLYENFGLATTVGQETLPWLPEATTEELPFLGRVRGHLLFSAIGTNQIFSDLFQDLSEEDKARAWFLTMSKPILPFVAEETISGTDRTIVPITRRSWISLGVIELDALLLEFGPFKGDRSILLAAYRREQSGKVIGELGRYGYVFPR